jgi:hypothetical protein
MKNRNGFVSNSSTSSFIAVGYKAKKKATKPEDYRCICEKKFTAKAIKKYALDYFMEDDKVNVDDFAAFPPLFWKEMWKEKKFGTMRNEINSDNDSYCGSDGSGEEYEVPAGLKYLGNECVSDGFVGILIVEAYEGAVSISPGKMTEAIEKVKSLAPTGASVKILAGTIE